MIAHVDKAPLLFFPAVFYTLRLRSGTDLITSESELHGWVSRMAFLEFGADAMMCCAAGPAQGLLHQPLVDAFLVQKVGPGIY